MMVCPDLDVVFEEVNSNCMFAMVEEFYCNDLTNEVYVMKGKIIDIPEGDHIQIRTNLMSDSIAWKIDIWFFPSRFIANQQDEIKKILKKLTPENREEIIKIKTSLIGKTGFSHRMSSYHVYEAFLNHDLVDISQIKEYLISKNVVIG